MTPRSSMESRSSSRRFAGPKTAPIRTSRSGVTSPLQGDYDGVAPLAGFIEYRRRGGDSITLGVLHAYVPNQGTAWQFTLDQLSQFFERVATVSKDHYPDAAAVHSQAKPAADRESLSQAEFLAELIGGYLENARILGPQNRPASPAPGRKSCRPVVCSQAVR